MIAPHEHFRGLSERPPDEDVIAITKLIGESSLP